MNRIFLKYAFIFLIYPLILILMCQYSGVIKKRDYGEVTPPPAPKPIQKPVLKTIVIDPGHGGIDSGTSIDGLIEKDITLSIAKRIRTRLTQMGYNILMTREGDTPLYKPSDIPDSQHRKRLAGRINYAKENNAKLFVSIHVNSYPEKPDKKGAIVYYYPKLEQSKAYAISVQKALNSIIINNKTRDKNYIETENFYVLKYSEVPSILIETAYITNSQDRKLLSEDSFRDKLADAISQGIDSLKLME